MTKLSRAEILHTCEQFRCLTFEAHFQSVYDVSFKTNVEGKWRLYMSWKINCGYTKTFL